MWDVFISYAAEDRVTVARPLAELLSSYGLAVWFDELELAPGMSLTEEIDRGLALSRFGAVVLSKAFFRKNWPLRELRGLTIREVVYGERTLLPIWHDVTVEDIARISPPLADLVALPTSLGLPFVSKRLLSVIRPESLASAAQTNLAVPPRLGYLSPIRPDDFRTLQMAYDRIADAGNAPVLCHFDLSIWSRNWGAPLPSAEVEAFRDVVAQTIRSTADPATLCIQFAADELGLLLLPGSADHGENHNQLESIKVEMEKILPQGVNVYVEMMSRCWGSPPSFTDAMRELMRLSAERNERNRLYHSDENGSNDHRYVGFHWSFTQ